MQIRNLKHNTRVGLKGGKGIAIVVAWLAGFVGAALAADDTVTITFTTMSATGGYSPRNVHVVYLTDTAGRFVTTVGNGTGTKRALCGNARAHDILQWFTGNPSAQSDIDARTGATETAYKTYAIAWNWTKRDGSVVPDGTYKLKFELTDDNSNKNKFNRTDLTVTKGRAAWKIGPVTQGGYKDVVVQYTPASFPSLACDPNAIDFGTQAVGLSLDRPFNILNSGTVAVTVTAMQITGVDKAAYSLIPATMAPLVLTPGGSLAVTVRFAPDSARTYNEAMVEITATGVAGVSLVAIKGRGEILPPQIEVSPDQLVFGQTQPGDSSSATLSISNTGPGPLYVQSMTFVGPDAEDFTLSGIAGDPFMVLPGMLSKDITVQFTPKTYKTYRATLAIGSDDPNLSVVNVALSQGLGLVACGSQGLVMLRSDGTMAGNLDTPGVACDVAVSQGLAYLAAGPAGVHLIDVHNASAPVLIITIPTPGPVYAVAVSGNDLYVAGRFGRP